MGQEIYMCPRKHEQDQVVPAGTGLEETERSERDDTGHEQGAIETWYSYMDHAAYWSATEPGRWCCLSCACLHGLFVACMHGVVVVLVGSWCRLPPKH